MGEHCTYEITKDGGKGICGRQPVIDYDEKCIFHSMKEGKEKEGFDNALSKIDTGDFTGFVFPTEVNDKMFSSEIVYKTDEIVSLTNPKTKEDYAGRKKLKHIFSDEHTVRGVEEGKEKYKTFVKELIFKEAVFKKGVLLSNLNFAKQVDMRACKFYGECNFNNSHFIGKLILDGISIARKIDFDGAIFHEAGLICKGGKNRREKETVIAIGEVSFREVSASMPGNMIFCNADLRYWSFLGTDVRKFTFNLCKLLEESPPIIIRGRAAGNILNDENVQKWSYMPLWAYIRRLGNEEHDEGKNRRMKEVLTLYRGLRTAYENTLRHGEARDFHIGEMEIRRLLLWRDKNRRFVRVLPEYIVTLLYKWASLYGESFTRPLLLFWGIITAWSIFYMFSGISYTLPDMDGIKIEYFWASSLPDLSELCSDFCTAWLHSLAVATFLVKERRFIYLTNFGWYLSVIESVFGAIIIPLFLLAVGRNFKRWRADS